MAKTVWVGLRHHKTQKYELQPFPKQTCVGTYASRYGRLPGLLSQDPKDGANRCLGCR
jgi:hypothetical protein